MKRLSSMPLAALAVLAALPAQGAEPGLQEVRALGVANGRALACGHQEAAGRLKAAMLRHAPKTRSYGEAYEEGTRQAFTAVTGGRETCPAPTLVALGAEAAIQAVQAALPAAKP
ncbi:MAG: hypothetical protein JNM82_01355 [Rhodocyclaceae bacterium]|nr:hypothetical protein [Rhodocyclaceae bacterium]